MKAKIKDAHIVAMEAGQQSGVDVDLMDGELTKQVCFIKFSLMACNAFGIMLGIFVVLFGISYPDVGFPGGYTGRETAAISGFFIAFTLIGYYGAHRQKVYFLVPYSAIIFLFLAGNLMMWGIKPEDSVLDPDSNAVLILAGVYLVLMVFALWLALQERKKSQGRVQVNSMAGLQMLPNAQLLASQLPMSSQANMTNQIELPSLQSNVPNSYGHPFPMNHVERKNYWNLNDRQLNVFYQPASNSYVTTPAQRSYGSVPGGSQMMF